MIRNHVTARYWLSHQRFFKYLCIACKVAKAVELSLQAVRDGKVNIFHLKTSDVLEFLLVCCHWFTINW